LSPRLDYKGKGGCEYRRDADGCPDFDVRWQGDASGRSASIRSAAAAKRQAIKSITGITSTADCTMRKV